MKKYIYTFLFLSLFVSSRFGMTASKLTNETISIINNSSLKSVLKQISNQTDINFIYFDEIVDNVSFTFSNGPIKLYNVFDQLKTRSNIEYKILDNCTLVLYKGHSTRKQINSSERIEHEIRSPELIDRPVLNYPNSAKEKGEEGSVILKFFVDKDGYVSQPNIQQSSGFTLLDSAALEYCQTYRYKPAQELNKPVGVWIVSTITYKTFSTDSIQNNYVNEIKRFYTLLKATNNSLVHDQISHNIYLCHLKHVKLIEKKDNLYDNDYLNDIIKPALYNKWKINWNTIPLYFLVFLDFYERFPNSSEAERALSSYKKYYNFINQSDLGKSGLFANSKM